jgi:hypothetical protein
MSEQETDFFASAKTPGGPTAAPAAPTAADYAAFLAWQASQTQQGAAPAELSEDDYEFKVGHLVRLGTGYGIVVGRAPVATSESGRNDGYIVAALGPANDTPVSAEQIGLTSL